LRNLLAICRDEAAFNSVLSLKILTLEDLVIASDDHRVHELAMKLIDTKVVYLSQIEPLFNVAPHVLKILGAVNSWLCKLGDNRHLPKELLYWVQHVEGGDTTQRIQDAVLEARSCLALFDQFQPSKLIIGAASKQYWEDEVLIACAKRRNITVQKLSNLKPSRIISNFRQQLRPLAKEIYRSVMTIDSLLRRRQSEVGLKNFEKYVAIQLCSSTAKHFNHTLPLIKAFEHAGLNAVAVTWDIGRAVKALRKQGYRVAELEAWVSPIVLLASWWAAFKGLLRAKSNLSTFLTSDDGDEYAAVIRKVLISSIRNFFISDVAYRIRLGAACKAFFKQNPPLAVRLWTRILEQGVIAHRAMAMIGVRPLLFWQSAWPYQLAWPYLQYDIPADLIFCLSDTHRERLQMDGEPSSKITVSGISWFQGVKEFSLQNTPHQSRATLGISSQSKLIVFCDAQYVLGGFCTAAEQSWLVQAVVEYAERNTDVCVLIKPHTGHKPGQLEAVFRGRGAGRVIWIPGKALPYDGLNASHVVLTKWSTLVAEAMVLGVPSICVLLDKDMRWAIYEDAVDYALSIEELNKKLDALKDSNYYSSWLNVLRKRQIDYMERHFPEPPIECNKLIANKVKSVLNHKANRA
jgi:hypothetical protein